MDKVVSEEDSWIEGFHLLNGKKIKVRYLFSAEESGLRLYRMDIKELNKDRGDNKINNVILDNDIITVWTDLNKEIKRLPFSEIHFFPTLPLPLVCFSVVTRVGFVIFFFISFKAVSFVLFTFLYFITLIFIN